LEPQLQRLNKRRVVMAKLWSLAFAFLVGYAASDLAQELHFASITQAWADVAGMDYYDLKTDSDFKKAVKSVVSGNCYIDGQYVYC
jgi:hypothetical protein